MIKLIDLLIESLSKDFEFPTFDYLDDKEKNLVEGLIFEFLDKLESKPREFRHMVASLIYDIQESGKELYGEKNPFHDVTKAEMAMVRDEPITLEFIKDFIIEYPDFVGYTSTRDDDLGRKLREILVNWMSIKKPNSSKLYNTLKKDIDRTIIMHALDANINR